MRDEEAILDRLLALQPNDVERKATRAFVELDWKADTRPMHQLIDSIRAKDPRAIQISPMSWLHCALAERDSAAAANALAALGRKQSWQRRLVKYSPRFVEGLIARMTKDDAKARCGLLLLRARNRRNWFAPILTMLVLYACLV